MIHLNEYKNPGSENHDGITFPTTNVSVKFIYIVKFVVSIIYIYKKTKIFGDTNSKAKFAAEGIKLRKFDL